MIRSALTTFAAEVESHTAHGPCADTSTTAYLPVANRTSDDWS
jgi:hypothetical protein